MKHIKIFRIIGIALILSLLSITVLAVPVSALPAFTLLTASGKIGDTIQYYGTGYTAASTVSIYLTNQNPAVVGYIMVTNITVYQTVGYATATAADTISGTFVIPEKIGSVNVTGGTYYLCTCIGASTTVVAVAPLTVIGNPAITLNPTTGVSGTSVTVTGSEFTPGTILAFKIDTTTVVPTAGQTSTLSNGTFSSTILVTAATAGAHTITVTAGTSTASATFTVTASAALDAINPASGAAGTDIVVSGAYFPSSTPLTIKYETTTLTIKSGDTSTRVSGIFSSTVTIPTSASSGAHTITVTAGTGTDTETFTVTSSAALNALSPATGSAGTDVTISGTNFPASTTLVIKFDDTTITPKSGDTATLTSGSFSTVITVPESATIAAHTITVTAGSATTTATFTVTASPSSVTISTTGNTAGSIIVIIGTSFKANGIATITYDNAKVAEGNINATGSFVVNFPAPASTHGDHIITATDSINSESIIFTMESTPPSVPIPLAPAMGASLKSPYLFDWNDVTDLSTPVTYELQVATAADFSANSIVFNKTGLKESQYKLTEAEANQISGGAAYYWRERAVDAASNASDWTGAGQFSVPEPFSFIGWPLYLTISIGGVVLFLAGLWLGRHTAFTY